MPNKPSLPVGESVAPWSPPAFPSPEVLQGTYCDLEPLNADRHAQDLYSANSLDTEGRNWTYLAYGPFASFENYRDWIDKMSQNVDPQFYSIIDRSTGKSKGVASYLRISPLQGSIEVGHIHFSPALVGTMAATESMYLMMKKAFELGYRRYEWKCDSLNSKSRSAAQRLGLSFEGVFRQATVYKGRNRDTAWFAAIDREWPALQDAFERWLDASNFDENGVQRLRLSELTRPTIANFDPTLRPSPK